ncbi:hypothetical protein BGZ74_009385 [Mortierella antarctica]|nr:hypothetical protein BGZ74_009385 [Mortierella antarctica]
MVKHESVTEEGRRECKKEDRMQHINDEEMSSPSQAHHPRVPKVDSSTASGSTSKRTVKVAPEDRIPRRTATIKIVQQPLHARMCGFGEKDRRPVDPPPIVQLLIDNGESPPDPDYNLFKLPQKKRLSAAAKRKKALAMGATSSSSSSGKATRSTRRSSETKTSRKYSESDDDEEGSNESDHDDHDSESEHSGSDSEDEERKGSSRHAKAAAAAATAMDTEIPRWEDFYENRDTGAIPLALDPLFVLHCSLWSHDGSEVRNMVATPSGSVSSSGAASHRREKASAAMAGASPMPPKLTRILMGSVVVSPILLFNEKGEQGWYFSFPDLSIRTEGVYTLKFSLLRLGSFDFMSPAENDEDSSPVIAEATSEPFTVFSAKKFPGMTESTLLSKAFARQGLKIPIRNDLRVRKNADKD